MTLNMRARLPLYLLVLLLSFVSAGANLQAASGHEHDLEHMKPHDIERLCRISAQFSDDESEPSEEEPCEEDASLLIALVSTGAKLRLLKVPTQFTVPQLQATLKRQGYDPVSLSYAQGPGQRRALGGQASLAAHGFNTVIPMNVYAKKLDRVAAWIDRLHMAAANKGDGYRLLENLFAAPTLGSASEEEVFHFLMTVRAKDFEHKTLAYFAARSSHMAALELLQSRVGSANFKKLLATTDVYGKTPLMAAARSGNAATITYLLNHNNTWQVVLQVDTGLNQDAAGIARYNQRSTEIVGILDDAQKNAQAQAAQVRERPVETSAD